MYGYAQRSECSGLGGSTPTLIQIVLQVFSSHEWALLGFLITPPTLPADAPIKLKISERPKPFALISLLEKSPPKDEATARQWFSALAGHVAGLFNLLLFEQNLAHFMSDFSTTELKRLSQMPIVPTKHVPQFGESAQTTGLRWLPPSQCYFTGDSRPQFHSKLFSFVDFGSRGNTFLTACGTKHEPSVEDVTRILLENPHQFYELANGRDK